MVDPLGLLGQCPQGSHAVNPPGKPGHCEDDPVLPDDPCLIFGCDGGRGSNGSLVSCSTVLPNGKTVGDYVRQFRQDLQNSANNATSDTQGDSSNAAATGSFFAIVKPNGPIDFKNTFKGQAPGNILGQAGNFAYYAIGSGLLPNIELDLGAGAYAVLAALKGHKQFSELTGRFFSDSSAALVRAPALAANGCKQ